MLHLSSINGGTSLLVVTFYTAGVKHSLHLLLLYNLIANLVEISSLRTDNFWRPKHRLMCMTQIDSVLMWLMLIQVSFHFQRYILQRHFIPKSQRRGPREFRGQTLFSNKIKGIYWILVRLTVNSLICNPNNFRPLISC